LKNGDLLAEAETKFEAFITSDQSLRYQQNRKGRRLAILELWTNDWRLVQPHMNEIIPIIANAPRWVVSLLSESLSARLLGGYSLLVLAK
jgi:hypothetical protein